MKKYLAYPAILRLHLHFFALWGIVALFLEILNQLQLIYQIPDNYVLGYGQIRPALATALIFGAGLNLLFAHGYLTLSRAEKQTVAWPPVGLAAVALLNLSVTGGILAIWLRFNSGREYGELPFLLDNGVLLSLVLFLAVVLFTVGKKTQVQSASGLLIFISASLIIVYFLGNIGLPIHPLLSISLFQGVQDAGLQEYYRFALLGTGIVLPSVAMHSVWQRNSSDENALSLTVILLAVTAALAGWSGLLMGPAHPILQTLGSVTGLVFAISVLAAAVLLWRAGPEPLARFSAVALVVLAIVFSISSLRSGAAHFGFTYLTGRDLVQAAFLLLLPAGILLFSRGLQIPVSARTGQLVLLGLGLSLGANVIQGTIQAFHSSENWISVLFAGQLFVDPTDSMPAQYWYSLRSVYFLGRVLTLAGMLLLPLSLFGARKEDSSSQEYLLVEEDR
ncbi:MAG: hypothetical protein HS115_06630 [Spirochaetales bacterium]|nr:hypothetical protein [Spirochaetales bacterium]